MDDNGDIIATCLNGAENRLIYVGESEEEKLKFDMFLELLRTTPTYKVPLTSEDLLLIPNSYYGKQTNVTHGRERLSEEEYKIPIEIINMEEELFADNTFPVDYVIKRKLLYRFN